MNTLRSKGLIAASSVAVLLALAGCDRSDRVAEQGPSVEQRTESAANEAQRESREAAAEAREESRQAANEARQESREAAQATREATAEARQDAREAADRTAEATREAAQETRTAVMGAAAETKEAASRLGERVEDAKITAQVKTGLSVDKDLKALSIDVDTRDGVVTLMGTAPTATAKARAAEIARNVKDVKSVNNQLNVAG